jgi:hypothetical protein
MDETLKKIREAYYRVGREQPPEYNPLPPWRRSRSKCASC